MPDIGPKASSHYAIPLRGWKKVLVRTWGEANEDNISLLAAGVSFYVFLGLVPLLAALVLSYGLIADPLAAIHDMQQLMAVMPAEAAQLVGDQLLSVVRTSGTQKGWGLLLALALALFSASRAAGSVVTALNMAYEEKEKRGFIAVSLLSLAITLAGVFIAIFATIAIAALGNLEQVLSTAPRIIIILGNSLAYLVLGLAVAAATAALYHFGPSRKKKANWVWLSPGSILVTVLWLAITLGFGIYVANFGDYNATYGSLAAVVILLTWLYLSSYVLLFGAELNSELERQAGHVSKRATEDRSRPV